MTELEFEKLKARVESLEAEVKILREKVMPKSSKNDAMADSIMPEQPRIVSIMAKCKKITFTDSQGVHHRNGYVSYTYNSVGYVAVTEADLPDSIWKVFGQQESMLITINEDVLYPKVNVNGIKLSLFGHVDTGDYGWRRVLNSELGRMEFIRVLPDENKTDDYISADVENQVSLNSSVKEQENDTGTKAAYELNSGRNAEADTVVSQKKYDEGFEKVLGTKWMGFFAAVLIFVAFIMFGASIYSFLNDYVKAAVLFIISGGFVYAGVHKLKQNVGNTVLWNIVAGCGIGGSYITILLMFMLFNITGLITTSILLILWIAATILLAKRFSKVFYYVCYLGVLISTVLCESMWAITLVSFIFYLAAVIAIMAAGFEKRYKANYFWMLQFVPVFVYFSNIYKDNVTGLIVMWISLLVIALAQPFVYEFIDSSDAGVYIIGQLLPSLLVFFMLAANLGAIYNDSVYSFTVAAAIVILLCNICYHFREKTLFINIWFYLAAIILPLLPYHDIYNLYMGYAVFMLPMLIYGIIKNRTKYMGVGCAYLAIYFYVRPNEIDDNLVTLISLVTVMALIGLCFLKYIEWLRIYLLIFVSIAVYYLADKYTLFNGGLCFLICAFITFCINNDNFTHQNPSSAVIVKIYSVVMTVIGYLFAAEYKDNLVIAGNTIYGSDTVYGIIIVLAAVGLNVLCSRYSYWLKITGNKNIAGVLTGTGYLFLVLAITNRFETAGIWVSILLIVMAICFIASGFRTEIKSIRIYGLILSIICTIKLVFFDIQYESNIYYPIGLFVCGGMCLFICWLYNRIEKNNLSYELKTEVINGDSTWENENDAE